MKLLFCTKCHDIIRLSEKKIRTCECGKTFGVYTDGLNAEYSGPCLPIGFANSSFIFAINTQPEEGMGQRFEAFVIPKKCPTMTKVKARK